LGRIKEEQAFERRLVFPARAVLADAASTPT